MKQKMANQGFKKNFILYKGHTGWKVKTRLFGSLVVALSAVTLAEGSGSVDAHAATDDSTATGQMTKTVKDSEKPSSQVALRSSVKSSAAPVAPASQESDENLNPDTAPDDDAAKDATKQPVSESEPLTPTTPEPSAADDSTNGTSEDKTSDSSSQYPVLSQDGTTEIGVDNTEVHLTADQIADHFTATVVDRDNNDKNVNPTKNTHVQTIGKDGSVALTSNDAHDVYSQYGTKTSITGHQVAHVSFEHEIDFGHDFSLSGALGIGTKTSGGADSVGVVFAPGNPEKATEGGSGGDLGIGGLANAFGFVFDEYPNSDKNDPSTPYFGWRTTDSNGNLQRVASSSEWMLASRLNLNNRSTNPLNDFTMDYDADTKTLTVTLGGQSFVRQISDTSQGYSISIAASTGGSQNDYSARIDQFTYTPKTMPLDYQMVDSADQGALLDQAKVQAIANVGDTVSVFSTQAAAARAVAAGLVDPNLIAILPTDSAGNVYVIDGAQTSSSTGTAKTIDNSGVADNTYYSYTVQDRDDQSVTIPVRLAFKAKVTPVDSKTGQPIAGLDPVTVVAVDGEPTLVQIPGYTPTKVTLAAPEAGEEVADDKLPIDQGSTNTGTDTTTTNDTATPISHYYVGTGQTVDGQTVTTGTVMAGTGQSVSDNFNQQPLVDSNGQAVTSGGKTITSSDYYWSTTGNAGATDSTDEANPQAGGSLLLPTTSTLDYWEAQATDNQTKADNYKAQAQQMYDKFMGITGLTQAQEDDAQALLKSVSDIYTNISTANGEAKADFEAAKGATAANDIYEDGQNGYASLEKVQNLLVSFEADLTNLDNNNTDAASSLATFESWSEDYGSPITIPVVSFGPDFWTNGTETSADFSNSDYYAFYSTDAADGDPVTPRAVGNYFFKLTDAGRAYLKSLNPNNDKIGLYVSAMLTIKPVETAATVDAATVEYGGGHAADGTVGTWPAFTGSLGTANADHTVSSADFEVVDGSGNVVTDITKLQAKGNYTIRYTQKAQAELAKDQNYTFTSFGTAKLTVAPRQITVTANNHGKTFGTADDPKLDLTSDSANGLVNGDTLDSLGVILTRTAGENAGTYDITEDESSQLNSNYKITVNKGTFTIARLPVTVQAKDLSKTYGDADPQLVLADTLVDGHQLTANDFTLSRQDGETAGTYKITGSDVATSNYNVTVKDGTFTITKRAITVQIDNQSKIYDGTASTDQDLTWEIVSQEGLAKNDTRDMLNVSLQRQAGEEVGHYAITGTFDNPNYDVQFIDGTLLINPRVVTVTVDPQEKIYGEADPTLTCQLSDGSTLAAGQKLSDLLTLTRDSGEDVGTYTISGASKSDNYIFEVTPSKLTIAKRAITVQIDNQSKIYDGTASTDQDLTWEIVSQEGLAKNDTRDMLNVSLQRQAGEEVGHYAITGTFDNSNYDVRFIDGTLLINPRVVTVTVDPQERIYGEADPTLTCQLSDGSTLAAGQKLSDLLTLTRDSGEDVGTYTISGASKSNNYTFTIATAKLTINKRAIVIQADNQRKVYGEDDPQLTWQVSGATPLLAKDSPSDFQVTLQRQSGENVGRYMISGSANSKNYDISIDSGTLLIDPRPVTVTIDSQTKVYGDANPELTWQVSTQTPLPQTQQPADLQLLLSCGTARDVGTYVISGATTNANYAVKIISGQLKVLGYDVDSADNVTVTEKDSAGNVTKVTKDWNDGSTTTYTYNPKTRVRKVTEQRRDRTTVSEQTITSDDTNVILPDAALPDGSDVETTVVPGQPGSQPTFDHYTTHEDIDKSNNVTTTTKDSTGNVTKVIKKWNDGSITTYTYNPTNPTTSVREVTEQQADGKIVSDKSFDPGDSSVTLPDGNGGTIVVKIDKSDTQPTITHYPASHNVVIDTPTDESTGEPEKPVTITKQWPDGSKIIYTYDPVTTKRLIRELRNGYLIEQQAVAPGSLRTILSDNNGGVIIVQFDKSGTVPFFTRQTANEMNDRYSQSATISNAGHARNLAETKRVHGQQEKKLPQTGQENESSLVRLGELLLTLLAVPFIFRRRH
ncbi:MBG domain-containing protein [Levilactobacillus suantsaiihabitans]|uniref:MBG domain-containing protein n=1 Tax=Levilactobacillus suantsaiihabitans TaxID=2487722 RepID=A0A4Z0J8G9_9LACO|nr:MBG domain-containing protein [Levilactobacillus suantsaiihabitans]TGD17967.1 hypothetical protein EGT51_10355 [Levilactobacillus suantsaiihabitans]